MIPFCFGGLCAEINIIYIVIAILIAVFGILAVIGNGRKNY